MVPFFSDFQSMHISPGVGENLAPRRRSNRTRKAMIFPPNLLCFRYSRGFLLTTVLKLLRTRRTKGKAMGWVCQDYLNAEPTRKKKILPTQLKLSKLASAKLHEKLTESRTVPRRICSGWVRDLKIYAILLPWRSTGGMSSSFIGESSCFQRLPIAEFSTHSPMFTSRGFSV